MGKGGSGAGSKVYDYYGSLAGVVCAGPVDELVALVVDNKMVWPGGSDWSEGVDEIPSVTVRRASNFAYVRFESPTKAVTGTAVVVAGFTDTSLNYDGTVTDGVDAYEFKYPSTGADFGVTSNTQGRLTKKVSITSGAVVRFRGRAYKALSTHTSTPATRPPNATYWTPYSVLRSAQADQNTAYPISVEGFGSAYFYWGTSAQLLDATGEALLAANGHPNYRRQAVLVLKDFLFGRERTTAPNVEVIVRRAPNQSLITGSAAGLDADSQANPVAVAAEWITDPVFGLGKAVLDSTTGQAIADELQADHSMACISPVLDRARPVRALFADLAQYFDGWFRWTSGGVIEVGRFVHDSTPPTFDATNTLDQHDLTDEPSWDVSAWSETTNSALVRFKDRERAFKDAGAQAFSSFNRKITGETRTATVERPWIKRRQQAVDHANEWIKVNAELFAQATVSVRAEKAATLKPGDPVRITNSAAGVSIDCRILEKTIAAPPSGTVSLKVLTERATGKRVSHAAPVIDSGSSAPLVESILRFKIVQVPPLLAGSSIYQVAVLAARTSPMTTGFRVWIRESDVTEFFCLGEVRSFAVTGTLAQAYSSSVGPTVDDSETLQLNLDTQTVAADLARMSEEQSADAANRSNILVWVFGSSVSEVMSLKAIRYHAGVYKLKVRRGRFGSNQSFSTGDRAFILYRSGLELLTSDKWPNYTPGASYSATFRLQAFNALAEADLTDSTVVPDISTLLSFTDVPGAVVQSFSTNIGDGSSSSIDVVHGLNTASPDVVVTETGGNQSRVHPEVQKIDLNTVRVLFPSPPTAGQYRVRVNA